MSAGVHLLLTLVVCTLTIRPLSAARWPWRSPRTGIVLWQLLALTWVLCVVGVAGRIEPWLAAIPTAAVLVAFCAAWWTVLRDRRRHRRVLDLVARADPAAPGVLVLDHPVAVAYCVPGRRARVVLSSGTLHALSQEELAAVLAHERTHARERHDLVMLPFTALRRLLPASRSVRRAAAAVGLLVEMRADDGACRGSRPESLVAALRRFGPTAAPAGTIGIGDTAVRARLLRLAGTDPLPGVVRVLIVVAGLVLVSTPLCFFVV